MVLLILILIHVGRAYQSTDLWLHVLVLITRFLMCDKLGWNLDGRRELDADVDVVVLPGAVVRLGHHATQVVPDDCKLLSLTRAAYDVSGPNVVGCMARS